MNNPWSGLRILGNNPVYSNTIISNERLPSIPENGQLTNIVTLEFKENTAHKKDEGPSPEQANTGVSQGFTHSGAQLPASNIHTKKVENIFHDIIGETMGKLAWADRISLPFRGLQETVPVYPHLQHSSFLTLPFLSISLKPKRLFVKRPISDDGLNT